MFRSISFTPLAIIVAAHAAVLVAAQSHLQDRADQAMLTVVRAERIVIVAKKPTDVATVQTAKRRAQSDAATTAPIAN
jgi:hypothetical protein